MNNFELTAIDGLLSLRDNTVITSPCAFHLNYSNPSSLSLVPVHNDRNASYSSGWSDSSSSQRSFNRDLKYHEHLIPRRKQAKVSVSLPPISDLLAYTPMLNARGNTRSSKFTIHGARNSAFTQFTRLVPYHPYSRRQVLASPSPTMATVDRRAVELQSVSPVPSHLRVNADQHSGVRRQPDSVNVYQYAQQLQSKILLLAREHQKLLASTHLHGKPDLSTFFRGLSQVYGGELENELVQVHQNEEDDSDSVAESSVNSNHDSSDQASCKTVKTTKTQSTKRKSGNGIDKPRWTLQEKLELFKAVIKHKKLDIMSSFDWAEVGALCGKQDKACKDQWRRGVLKMLIEFFNASF